ncbi:hypothetical protein L1987_78869 [Smallanthus sonchifolius]|uniref:Uncharacterized protein n=1 Tax=Smallanthus sonchifolius TaxID=185202 RepID=A0ACB8ZEG4_9ASTR|nr:hypothetical protein L1987_78869 [Smallanthus sonchifolius]
MVGGMSKLYKSLSDLNDDYIQSDQQKDVLLKPKSTLPFSSPQLPLLSTQPFLTPPPTPTFYKCTCNNNLRSTFVCRCPACSRTISTIDDIYVLKSAVDAKGGGFVKGLVTYMVSVSPMFTISSITSLNKYNIKDLGALDEKVVHIGMNEGLELLKHSLNSKTLLTNVFLGEVVVKDDYLKKV